MGTIRIALKRSHTEKAKLTRARPRFSFGFSIMLSGFFSVSASGCMKLMVSEDCLAVLSMAAVGVGCW